MLLRKRWDLFAEYQEHYWRERKQLGLAEALRVVDSLRSKTPMLH